MGSFPSFDFTKVKANIKYTNDILYFSEQMEHIQTIKQMTRTVNEISYDYSGKLRNTSEAKEVKALHQKLHCIGKLQSFLLKLEQLETKED